MVEFVLLLQLASSTTQVTGSSGATGAFACSNVALIGSPRA